jgi:hypothetical protein
MRVRYTREARGKEQTLTPTLSPLRGARGKEQTLTLALSQRERGPDLLLFPLPWGEG